PRRATEMPNFSSDTITPFHKSITRTVTERYPEEGSATAVTSPTTMTSESLTMAGRASMPYMTAACHSGTGTLVRIRAQTRTIPIRCSRDISPYRLPNDAVQARGANATVSSELLPRCPPSPVSACYEAIFIESKTLNPISTGHHSWSRIPPGKTGNGRPAGTASDLKNTGFEDIACSF